MYKETRKTTKFIDFKIQKYSLSMTIQKHSDTLILFLSLMGNTVQMCAVPYHPMGRFPWDSHRNPIPTDKPGHATRKLRNDSVRIANFENIF